MPRFSARPHHLNNNVKWPSSPLAQSSEVLATQYGMLA